MLARLLEENRQCDGGSEAAVKPHAADDEGTAAAAPTKQGRKKKGDDAPGPGLPGVE